MSPGLAAHHELRQSPLDLAPAVPVGVDLGQEGGDVLLLAALKRMEAHHAGLIAFTWATFGRHFFSSWIS
jgi:hypothetical protein